MQLTDDLSSFDKVAKTISEEIFLKATDLPANTVQVWPGGATFNTIQAAIDSIKDAGPMLQYNVAVGQGTYNETVTMKDYVYIGGAGSAQTTVIAPGQFNFASGTINSASNCGISEMSVQATGGSWGTCPVAIKICGTGKFHISGVNAEATDGGNEGNNVRCLTNNVGSNSCNIVIGQSKIIATGTGTSGVAVAIESFYKTTVYFIEISLVQGVGSSSYGVSTAVGSSATLYDCNIGGTVWALYNSDQGSPITATNCSVMGPVSAGVVVN